MMVSIVCVGDVGKSVTQKCIDSFRKNTHQDTQLISQKFIGNYNKALNSGASIAKGDYIVFCNNDVYFTDYWFEKLLPHFDKYDSLSPHCPFSRWWKEQPTGVIEGYEIGRVLCGWCIVMPRSTYEKIGGFDEGVEFWYSDNIYADQLKYHGLKHALVTDSIVYHEGSKTLNTLNPDEKKRLTIYQDTLYLQAKQKYYA